MTTKSFTVELERAAKTSARFRVPVDLEKLYGRARPPLKVTVRGHTLTHQREYVEWVEEAKRPETQTRGVAGTVDGVRSGKHR